MQTNRFTLGGYNTSYADITSYQNGSITWNDLINTNYWSLGLTSIKFGGKALTLSTHVAIVDTGTSYILMPDSNHIK